MKTKSVWKILRKKWKTEIKRGRKLNLGRRKEYRDNKDIKKHYKNVETEKQRKKNI